MMMSFRSVPFQPTEAEVHGIFEILQSGSFPSVWMAAPGPGRCAVVLRLNSMQLNSMAAPTLVVTTNCQWSLSGCPLPDLLTLMFGLGLSGDIDAVAVLRGAMK